MSRKSAIERGPAQVRTTIDKLIRQGRLTLDEIREYVAEKHGTDQVPSRSGLHRYTKSQQIMLDRMRRIDRSARALVSELGESPDDKAGALLVQSITVLANEVADREVGELEGDEPASIDDVRKLARAGKDIINMRQASLKERREVERLARDKLLQEQNDKLEQMGEQGLSAEQVEFWQREFLGMRKG